MNPFDRETLRSKVYFVGVGDEGIPSLAFNTMQVMQDTDWMIGEERRLAFFPNHTAQKIPIGSDLATLAETLRSNLGKRQMVVLTGGDPNFHDIAPFFIERLGKEVVEVLPAVSAMQLAFARIKEPWGDALLLSMDAQPIKEVIVRIRSSPRVGLFTDPNNRPDQIAKALLAAGIENRVTYVCEDLGRAEERVTKSDLEHLATLTCAPLTTLVMIE